MSTAMRDTEGGKMVTFSVRDLNRREILKMSATLAGAGVFPSPGSGGGVQPEGQLTWAVHFTLAPTLFEPAETPGLVTPFMILYALHDAMLKPMPGKGMAPSLAESFSMSSVGLIYELVLRKGTRFHNGEAVTAEDVKFSFERYRGSSSKPLKDHVAAVETPDPSTSASS